ncbi:gamma-aminobutyrate transaminase POP2 [Cucumis melo var. makuwa]|uniref:Gamma-aminobutyrate transaminase POP2 n=1 Tax=Cucumis melo var. makuwa TaxID=1194695 RepID=A0A5A7T4Y9_CUCMM|nr:gamma-aminobutyrate transaminase POP2 [Cucumis melo var. makuwa]TYK13867.1 gamma-aminobutyrate transaminase POP2 [Cucumis melo var. makuwa]
MIVSITRNRGFPDVKNDVDTKNVRKRGKREERNENSSPSVARRCLFRRRYCPSSPSATLAIMSSSYPRNNFMETDAMFLEFKDDLDNIAGGSSSVGDNADVGREYIEVVKGNLQRLFVLDFNDQAMNRFVEHQMLTTFKEFRDDECEQFLDILFAVHTNCRD